MRTAFALVFLAAAAALLVGWFHPILWAQAAEDAGLLGDNSFQKIYRYTRFVSACLYLAIACGVVGVLLLIVPRRTVVQPRRRRLAR